MPTRTEQEIEHETKRIEQVEKKIEKEEKKILRAENKILTKLKNRPVQTLATGGFTKKELIYLRKVIVKRVARHKFFYIYGVTVGLVLVWRGTWHTLDLAPPPISDPILGLVAGILILLALERYTELISH